MLLRTALRSSLGQVRHVTPVRHAQAEGVIAAVYAQVERDFGLLAPPVGLHSPAPGPLTACWAMLRETLVVPGTVARPVKEAVAAAVSMANACPYCVEVHGATLSGLGDGPVAAAVAANRIDTIEGPAVRAIATWARHSGTLTATTAWPFPAEHAPELIGVAVTFHYLNRMVSLFLGDSALPDGVPKAARGSALRALGRSLRAVVGRGARPGESLHLLPDAPLPPDLVWAGTDPVIGAAFARAAAAVDAAGARSVPPPVRAAVATALSTWDGSPPGPSRAWLEDGVACLAEADRPAGRLALLAAMAPHQADGAVVEAARTASGDVGLVELCSWSALSAARTIGAWVAESAPGTASETA